MRRLMRRLRAERGATATVVAFALIPLLGAGAIAVDVGALYAERAQLQNGVDAAALAIAAACAKDEADCATPSTQKPTAQTYVAANAAILRSPLANTPAIDTTLNVVTVTATTSVDHVLASMLTGTDATVVGASGSAEWGVPVRGTSIALTIAECEFVDLPPQEEDAPNPVRTWITIEEDGSGAKQTHCADGSPGGFGWLDGTNCESTLSIDSTVGGTVGIQPNENKNGCSDTVLESLLCTTVLIPLFSETTGSGQSATFTISKFAAFRITGLKTSGANSDVYCGGSALAPEPPEPKGKTKGIQGYFVKYVSVEEAFQLGQGAPTGLSVVRMMLTPTERANLIG